MDVYLKNGLAEKREGEREGGRQRRKRKFRVPCEGQENWEEHIFKPMFVYLSSQTKQVHKGKKFRSFLRGF